jgi:hypothetical protein
VVGAAVVVGKVAVSATLVVDAVVDEVDADDEVEEVVALATLEAAVLDAVVDVAEADVAVAGGSAGGKIPSRATKFGAPCDRGKKATTRKMEIKIGNRQRAPVGIFSKESRKI